MPPINPDLLRERSGVSFPVEELTHFIFGGPKKTEKRRWLRSLLDVNENPAFVSNDRHFLSRDKYYVRTLERVKKLIQYKKQYNIVDRDEWIYIMYSTGDSLHLFLHDLLFIPTLEGQMSDEQQKKWLPLAYDYAIFGCYAQTELGHGSNVRKLETTATFIHETDEFELHSPTLTSIKWWPGALARTSTHAAVFARLIIDDKDYGVHPFLAQLRGENHKPLPGIEVGDVGPKFGYNNIDNGFLRLTHYRIPRDQMFMRFSKVSRDGKYSASSHAKTAYGTLINGRVDVIEQAPMLLARAECIAIRYSIIRKQGNDTNDNPNESMVLDYQSQQHNLFNGLSMSYTFKFTARWMRALHEINKKKLAEGDIGMLGDVHSISSGLKALFTDLTMEAIEIARRACGGYGYSQFSGMPHLLEFYAQCPTIEGENTILYLQTGRYIIKAFESAKRGRPTPATLSFLKDFPRILEERSRATTWEELIDPKEQVNAFSHRLTRLLAKLIENLEKFSINHPRGYEGAKSSHMIDIINASKAYCYMITLKSANEGLEEIRSTYPNIYPTLRVLINLFFANTVVKTSGEFLSDNYFNYHHIEILESGIKDCLKKIRPESIGLVDAWEFDDNTLVSAIGRYDGNAYETLYNWAKMDPLNLAHERGEYVGYNEVMKDILSGEYLKEINKSKL